MALPMSASAEPRDEVRPDGILEQEAGTGWANATSASKAVAIWESAWTGQ